MHLAIYLWLRLQYSRPGFLGVALPEAVLSRSRGWFPAIHLRTAVVAWVNPNRVSWVSLIYSYEILHLAPLGVKPLGAHIRGAIKKAIEVVWLL